MQVRFSDIFLKYEDDNNNDKEEEDKDNKGLHRCVGHTAWAPEGREGQSQADLKGHKGPLNF